MVEWGDGGAALVCGDEMIGRVKDHWHEEICANANEEPWGPEPDAEQFYADREVELAKEVLRRAAALGLVKKGTHHGKS